MRTYFSWSERAARLIALALILVTASLFGCNSATTVAPVLHGDVTLTLLHTADWHSRLFPYDMQVNQTDTGLGLQQSLAPFGGAARLNYLIQRERARSDRVLHLDAGDCFEGAPVFNFFNGEAEVRALDHTGVDAVVIGNHEFDHGPLNFAIQYSRWASFETLAANYLFLDPNTPGDPGIGRFAHPYTIFNLRGLKVGVIGMGNLSSLTIIFDQPNPLGITPLNTVETAQFYVDMLKSQGVDVIVVLSHLGPTDDITMIQNTSGIDVVLGGHLHIVLDPTLEVTDCQAFDQQGRHFIPAPTTAGTQWNPHAAQCAATECCDPSGTCAPQGAITWWRPAIGYTPRYCNPRRVLLQHSGAFVKYLGRLDTIFSDDPQRIYGPDRAASYDPADRFEVVSHQYSLFPVDSSVPEEPTMTDLLQPYARALDTMANLDTIIGYAPAEVSRTATSGGDSPLGNLVSDSMWLRLGVQTDFSLTNTLGIRDNIPPGPVTIDQMYNVFPFDNSITTMNLSGYEVQELFDFVARRSAGRGCNSQAQIAGARVLLVCGNCPRADAAMLQPGGCAATINIGLRDDPEALNHPCNVDADCNPAGVTTLIEKRSLCEPNAHRCMVPLSLEASYTTAVNNYIAAGGSGFLVLQRNTSQVNTGIQQRDAVIDYVRQAEPCGYDSANTIAHNHERGITDPVTAAIPQAPDDGLPDCQVDSDCETAAGQTYVCACAQRAIYDSADGTCHQTPMCPRGQGRCIISACQNDMVGLVEQSCPAAGTVSASSLAQCQCTAVSRAMMSCRILSCVDRGTGAFTDSRLVMETL